MIKLDLSKAVKQEEVWRYNKKVKILANKIETYDIKGSEFFGWKDLTKDYKRIVDSINSELKKLKQLKIETLVVIGVGGSSAGAKAAIEMIKGNHIDKNDIEVIFAGEGLSSFSISQQFSYLKKRRFAINVISKSGDTLETSICFRLFKTYLQEKVGITESKKLIFATTDANNGNLLNSAIKNGWKRFIIPDSVIGRYSVLTAAGLFPMACAGLDIKKIMLGAEKANELFADTSLENNIAYQYAVARIILNKKYPIELLVQTENNMNNFTSWWKQLVSESEGKNGKGIFPAGAIFSNDLHSLGQYIQEGTKNLFETIITIQKPQVDIKIFKIPNDDDKLNYLFNRTINNINKNIIDSVIIAHNQIAKVPVIKIQLPTIDETILGYLFIFFQRAIVMTGYLLDVNPLDQPGVEIYKVNLKKILKKI